MTVLAIMFLFPVLFYVSACYLAFGYEGGLTPARLESLEKKVSEDGNKGIMRMAITVSLWMSLVLIVIYVSMKTIGDPRAVFGDFLVFVVSYAFCRHLRGGAAWAQVSWGPRVDLAVGILACLAWIFFPGWITADIFGVIAAVMILVLYRNLSAPLCLAVSIGIIVYDAFHVFGTRIMQEVAFGSGATALGLLTIPESLSSTAAPLVEIGVGDLVTPGLIVMLAYRIGKVRSAAGAIIGYVVGIALTMWVNIHFDFPQPATIYLIPGVWVGYWIATNLRMRKQEVL